MIGDAALELSSALEKAGLASLQPASAHDLELAKSEALPQILIDFYRARAPDAVSGVIELDQRIWSVENTVAENKDYVPGAYLFPLGYVVFASNRFGDAYCLDTIHPQISGDYPVVLFPHDVIEEGVSLQDVERYRLVVAENLEDFVRQFSRRMLIDKPRYG